jgi:MATE family multidrug resistance protein
MCLFLTILLLVRRLSAESVLIFVGQDEVLANLAGEYIRLLLPGLIPNIITNCVSKFLQAQGLMNPQMYVYMIVFPINVLMQYFLVYADTPWRLGFYGAPIGSVIADTLVALLLVLYVRFVDGYQYWHPWTRECLSEWGVYFSLGLPGMLSICSEWWIFEAAALLAGVFGAVPLAAQSVILNSVTLAYMIFLGLAIACSNRVGNFLGGNRPDSAKNSAFVSMYLTMILACITFVTLFSLRKVWGHLFTSDSDVIKVVATVMPLCALFQFADGGCCVLNGILRGCGKQSVGACTNLITYYVLGIPLALFFTFYLDLQLLGIWIGLTVSLWITLLTLWYYVVARIDWNEVARCARQRVNRSHQRTVLYASDTDAESECEGGLLQNAY